MLSPSKENSSKANYKFYATLLDAFQRYLTSEADEAFQEFIDRLNRVPFVSEAAEKGTRFNELVDGIKNGNLIPIDHEGLTKCFPKKEQSTELPVNEKGLITYGGFLFKWAIVEKFVDTFKWAHDQVYVEAILPTSKGNVLLYGYIDEVLPGGLMSDIKTTGNYEFPKFLHNWQHIVYPYCMNANGIPANWFSYDITDFNNYYKEDYNFSPERDAERLKAHCEQLIDFIEQHKDKITDRKLFALDTIVKPQIS